MTQSDRYSRRSRDAKLSPAFSFTLLVEDVDLTASPDQAAKDGEGSLIGHAKLMRTWQDRAGSGDARAMACMGIYLALTGQREQARAWHARAATRMAEGPGPFPSSGILDADSQLGMLGGLLDPLADGLRMD